MLFKCGFFYLPKKFEPSSAANAARIGRKRRQEAAVSERRRLEGADRKSARERPVQVRELAISLNVEFFVIKNKSAGRFAICEDFWRLN